MNTEVAKAGNTTPVTIQDSTTIMEVISRAASDPNTDIDKLERLMGMYERLELKKAETAFNAALTAAQEAMTPISADATNPQTKSRYASYPKLDKALRPIYTKHGFALSFDEGDTEKPEHVRVLCHVSHRAGYTRTYHRDMPSDGKGPKGGEVMSKTHAAGSAQSYGMRYLLKAIFNVAVGEDDNDGNQPTIAITEQQAADLNAMIEEVGADKSAFLKVLGVEKLEHLPAVKYAGAVKRLEKKRNEKKRETRESGQDG